MVGTRPNILLITTDYQRGVDLPSHGSPFLAMPNLDRLCREGAVFGNHVSTSPICMPARASWVTGLYPHTHGLWDNIDHPVPKDGPFLMRDLQALGYLTAGIGKMHLHPFEDDHNFDIRVSHEGKDQPDSRDDDYGRYLKANGLDRGALREFQGNVPMRGSQRVYDWPLAEELHHDYFVGNEAVKAIHRGDLDGDKPWFTWVSFPGPHNPWTAPKRVTEPYRQMPDLPLGDHVEGELMGKPLDCTRLRYCYGEGLWDVYDALPPEEQEQVRRELKAQHYGSLTFIDEQIGRVLDGLEARGELENTTIVFTSDHGSALFDNGMLHKGDHFPSQAIVPFVVWHPGTVTPGVRTNFSAHVDLYPTLMEIAGGAPHQGCEGTSIVPMLGDAKAAVKEFDVIECVLITSIVTHKWIAGFNHYNEEVDLYDRIADPMCHHNIADDPANARVIDDLRGKLVAWRRNLSPDLDIPDDMFQWRECLGPPDVIAQFRKNYLGQYQRMSELDEAQRPGRVGKHVPAAYRSGPPAP